MDTQKISVIVPVYNVEKYLSRCIDSIISQTFSDFELILVDDGSTDSSGKICDEYGKKDGRVKVIHKKTEVKVQHEMQELKIQQANILRGATLFWDLLVFFLCNLSTRVYKLHKF